MSAAPKLFSTVPGFDMYLGMQTLANLDMASIEALCTTNRTWKQLCDSEKTWFVRTAKRLGNGAFICYNDNAQADGTQEDSVEFGRRFLKFVRRQAPDGFLPRSTSLTRVHHVMARPPGLSVLIDDDMFQQDGDGYYVNIGYNMGTQTVSPAPRNNNVCKYRLHVGHVCPEIAPRGIAGDECRVRDHSKYKVYAKPTWERVAQYGRARTRTARMGQAMSYQRVLKYRLFFPGMK